MPIAPTVYSAALLLRLRSMVPIWYHIGMSKQIAIRLPNELVAFVDGMIASGAERSRATFVARALEREQRRVLAANDAAILARTGPDHDLAGLAEYAAGVDHDRD
jgi:Arc/MetJ-type ribon-helix-helix transcriptional regulator